MLPPGRTTPAQALAYYHSLHEARIASGQYLPFLYPWTSLGGLVIIAYLVIDHRQSPFLRACRFPIFAFVFTFELWCIIFTRCRNPSGAVGVGLLSCYSVLWVARLAVVNDCQTDFCRIDRNKATTWSDRSAREPSDIQNGLSSHTAARHGKVHDKAQLSQDAALATYYWQSYPSGTLLQRLDWILDMFCSFRGVGWNWQMDGIPPLPATIAAQLKVKGTTKTAAAGTSHGLSRSRYGITRYYTRKELIRISSWNLIHFYLTLDVLKTIISHDPWFWGYTDRYQQAPAWIPTFIAEQAAAVKAYRLFVAMWYVYTVLQAVFAMGPLFFCGLLGPRWIGVRGEPWMQPTSFGSMEAVFDKGLAGWWSNYWHQTFRTVFQAPAVRLCQVLAIEPRSQLGRLLGLTVAFFLSGCIHACGSHTQTGETHPLRGPMVFFLLQSVGIALQTWLAGLMNSIGIASRLPTFLRKTTNFGFCYLWLYHTGPLFVNDFTRGGVWLQEPIPFSLLRGLGLGAPDESWWCWRDIARWRWGQHWWDTGIEF